MKNREAGLSTHHLVLHRHAGCRHRDTAAEDASNILNIFDDDISGRAIPQAEVGAAADVIDILKSWKTDRRVVLQIG